MSVLIFILGLFISYITIQMAIDKSINTRLQKENTKILNDIKKLLEDMQK